ncbi:hypothetical protein BC938DRAFT_481501 [Jimgerdemannia flammicorona]|uniref:Zinc finger PHD-type domain-containing protein n=1 Tax=Jimgerdemannia flammicorona TaxID=994334 RepID=A0A433QFZ4_9FUNG|nr:hypothetical protein BC938DRAFT_481501 [Jimgerdemannia flammicorona]
MTAPRRSRTGGRGASARQQALAAQQQHQLTSEEEESSDEDSVTRCVCGQQHHVGLMVQCDKCEVWQHCECVGLIEEDIPDQYYCELCKPENHTLLKPSHGKSKRAYNPNGGKDTASKKTPRKRTTMNSREAADPASDAVAQKGTASKNNSHDDGTGRGCKRLRKTDGPVSHADTKNDDDDDEDEPHDSRNGKSHRSTSPAAARNSGASRKRGASKSSIDSAGSNHKGGTGRNKRSRSGSPLIGSSVAVVQEPRSYESDNEASSGSGTHTTSTASKKRRRTDDKAAPSRATSTSVINEELKPDPVHEHVSLEDVLFAKEDLSDVETALLGGDDDDDDDDDLDSIPVSPKKDPVPVSSSTKVNGTPPRPHPVKRSSSSQQRKNPSAAHGSSRSRDNSHSSHHNNHTSSSRTSTPQPADNLDGNSNGGHGHSSHDKDKERSRCLSPPTKVRYPSSRMSLSEMNKRVKQILEYISRMQVEIVDKKKEPKADAKAKAEADEDGSPVEQQLMPMPGVETNRELLVVHIEGSSIDSSIICDGEAPRSVGESIVAAVSVSAMSVLATAASPSTPSPRASGIISMELDEDDDDDDDVELSQAPSASSSATTIPLERPRSVSPCPIVAPAPATTTMVTATASESHAATIHPQPSLSSSSTTSTISSATTTLTSDADVAVASSSAINNTASELTSIEMMDKLASELISFQRRFGQHQNDGRSTTRPSAQSAASAANGPVSSSFSSAPLAPAQQQHNTRERERSVGPDHDVVESLLMMSAVPSGPALGHLATTEQNHAHHATAPAVQQQHHHSGARHTDREESAKSAGGRHVEREESARSAFIRRNEGAGGRRVASVAVR